MSVDTMENKIRTLLDNNRPTVATRLWSTWPTILEATAASGNFDYVEFLAEYAPSSQRDLENLVRAAELHNISAMIKVDFQNRHFVAQKAVSMGFQAVLYCDHRTADEVEESVYNLLPDCMGEGRFGYPNARWIGYHPHIDQMRHAQVVRSTVKAFMIEKKEAMDNIEAICKVKGVDMVQFGPSDFSLSCGWSMGEHKQELQEMEECMIRVALEHGVAPRCECDTMEQAEYYRSLGVKHFCFGDEFRILNAYWNGPGGALRAMADAL